jgi:hypothetical protein
MSSREPKVAQVNLRLKPTMKALAEKAAEADQRSLTSLIEKLLADYLRAKGYLPAGSDAAADEPSPAKPAGKKPKG